MWVPLWQRGILDRIVTNSGNIWALTVSNGQCILFLPDGIPEWVEEFQLGQSRVGAIVWRPCLFVFVVEVGAIEHCVFLMCVSYRL